MNEPKEVDGWNVAELAGGLLLSAEGFIMQLSMDQVDKFLEILNTGVAGTVRDSNGDPVQVSSPKRDHVVLTRVNDTTYPNGIILPVDAFSELESEETPVIEGVRPAYRRVGSKIKRGFRVTTGIRKGRVLADPAGANKPRVKALTRAKLRAAAHRNRLVRALKAKITRKKSVSIRLRRMNHTNEDLGSPSKIFTAKGMTRDEAMKKVPWKKEYGDCRAFSYDPKTGVAIWT
jgi:hypothetical protein